MSTVARLTPEQIEELAVEIRTFLLNHDMWVDTAIYFNGKCFSTYDRETGKFYYQNIWLCERTKIREIILSMWLTITFSA